MSASVDIQKFLQSLGEARARGEAAAVRAVDRFGQMVITTAKQKCPVKTGDLKRSGTTLPSENHDGRITKVIGFNMIYAAAVHEKLTAKHTQGEAKFLEKAMRESADKFVPYVIAEVKKALG